MVVLFLVGETPQVKLIGGKWWVSGFQRKVLGVVSRAEDKG